MLTQRFVTTVDNLSGLSVCNRFPVPMILPIDLPAVLPQCIHELRETRWTVGVREREIGRIDAIDIATRPLRDPVLTIRGRSGLVSNLCAETTDSERHRSDARLSQRSGRHLTSGLSDQSFMSHTAPPSFTRQTGTSPAATN